MTNVIEEQGNMALSNAQEERILVSIRIRPLNKREKARHDTRTTAMWNHDHSQWIPMPLGIWEEVEYKAASIFAYRQTSSGKTHTMSGITEYVERDIYEYIEKHKDIEFVNFVDLVGSECASQAMTAGIRLREGSHINHSLLSLETLIRKLSIPLRSYNVGYCMVCEANLKILEGVTDIDLVVNLKLQEEALLAKCLGRRICNQCGGNFNIASISIKGENGRPGMVMAPLLPPAHCMSKLITRSDDTKAVVKERLRIYNEKCLTLSTSVVSQPPS
ncbi:Adenylate kinase 1, chloroplastic [Glycine soja]|uniref:Adenylate kinase 1, chloroplastic n=1 Tax=Glycine soja TaxID=3848 RepID=A0A445GI95_GLYSO|nr:Adenylate kinase 1, chloroplastic [Glycine soja]